jgi:membrane-associated phospholipid phosphatase
VRGRGAVRTVTRSRPGEHALLATPRRDIATVAALAVVTAAFFVAMAMAGSRARIGRLDTHFLHLMVSIRTPWLTTIAQGFNFIGLAVVTLPIRLLIAGFLAFRRRWWHLAAFASAVVVSEVFIGTLKGLYARGRPPGSLVATSGYSFPSGHAVAASVTAVAAVIALFPEGAGRYAWGTVAVAFSGLMALSRAYLAAHWLSDAVAGVLLGTSCALVMALAVHAIRIGREGAGGPEATAGRGEGRSPPPGLAS